MSPYLRRECSTIHRRSSGRSSWVPEPNSSTPRSRSESRAAPCGTRASSSSPAGVRFSRPCAEAAASGRCDDPHTVLRFGRLDTQLRAAQELLRWAAEVLTAIGLEPADEEQAAHGSLAVARAKAFGSETAVLVASDLFAMTGASGTDERHDLNRHWRNARTHSVHDPVDWKYHHIGAHALTGVAPPNHGQL